MFGFEITVHEVGGVERGQGIRELTKNNYPFGQ
jgi:hypothetical protein